MPIPKILITNCKILSLKFYKICAGASSTKKIFTKFLFEKSSVLRPTSHLIINFKVGWGEISDFLPGRTDVQCRARWRNHLQPDLVKGPWTKEEDEKVLSLVSQHGPRKWAFIAKHLKGRVKKK